MFKSLKFSLSLLIFFGFSIQIFAQTQTAKDLFEQGLRLVKEQKFEDALAAFRKSAQLDAKQSATHGNIGSALLALARPAEAVAPFREAVRLAPNDARFRIGLCQSLSMTKNHAEAVSQCEQAVRIGGANAPITYDALITALRAAQRTDDALRAANAALQKFAENEMFLNLVAELNAETGNHQRATEIYETLTRLKPASVLYQIKLAENYLRLERDADAIAALNNAIKLEKHPLAYFFLGRLYFELGQNEEAANAFRESNALDEKFPDAFYFLGLSETRRGKSENAIAALRKAVTLESENFHYNKELGSALIQSARYDEAVAPLKKAAALNPKDLEAKVGLGLALFESANYDEGLAILAEADRMQPGNQVINMFLNVSRARQQGIAEIEEMKRFAKENPKNLDVRLRLVQILGFARRMPEAEIYVQEILQLNPKDANLILTIATVYSTAGKEDKTLEFIRKSLEIEENSGAYLNLAGYHAKRGEIREAERAYAKVLELKPDSPNVMKLYADLLRDNGKRREALAMYERSLSLLPTNAPAIFNAGLLSAKLGNMEAARQYLETLKAIDPQTAKSLARFLNIQK